MPTNIKCPHCANTFDVEDVLSSEAELRIKASYESKYKQSLTQIDEIKNKLADQQNKLAEAQAEFEEKRKNQNELFQERLQQEKQKMQAQMQQDLRKTISQDFENQLQILREADADKNEKLKLAQRKELEFMRKEQELKNRESQLELQLEQRLVQERQAVTEQVRKEEAQRIRMKEEEHQFKVKDLQMQLQDQLKLVEEMKRKAEQGSMQRQGEVQELLLEEMLKDHFPFDVIGEVGKGVEGADCIQTVRNHLGQDCGKIIFESKRTKTFNSAWIEKLKTDMRSKGADVAILVTQVYPKDFLCFGEMDGVWICSFSEVLALTNAMRHTIMRIADTKKSEENRGEKMHLLYSYLTGNEFRQQMETIVEGFLAMKNGIDKERIQMEKQWKEREKQLQKVLLSTSGLYGSIKGIAGAGVANIPLLDNGDDEDKNLLLT